MGFNVFIRGFQPQAAAAVAIAITGGGAIVCVQAAIACYREQQKHQQLLRSLKAVCAAGALDLLRFIDQTIENLEKQDYQTKLAFLPLNPIVLKGVIGYFVTGCTALVYKQIETM